MADPSADELFDAIVRLFLFEHSVIVSFAADASVRIKIPATRRIADFLKIPHYLVLRSLAIMENDGLVRKEERAGIVTTDAGSRIIIRLLMTRHYTEAEALFGPVILDELARNAKTH